MYHSYKDFMDGVMQKNVLVTLFLTIADTENLKTIPKSWKTTTNHLFGFLHCDIFLFLIQQKLEIYETRLRCIYFN